MLSNLLNYLTYLFRLIKYIEDHSGFYMFLVTLITFGVIIWYAWETRRIAKAALKPLEDRRKSIAKNLLLEVHDNKNILKEIQGEIDYIEENKTIFYPILVSDFLLSVYKQFTEISIDFDFNDKDTSPSIRTFYTYLKEITPLIKEYNTNILQENKYSKKNMPYSYMEFRFKIPILIKLSEELFISLVKESGFEYSKKDYFYNYKPYDFHLNKIKDEQLKFNHLPKLHLKNDEETEN